MFDIDDTVADAIEEFAIVRDQQQRAGIGPQPGLEPEDRVDVEVVGGFVEQQQVGAAHERTGNIDAHPPAAGKSADRPLVLGVLESQAVHELRGARPRVIAAHLRVTRVQRAEARAIVVFGRHRDLRLDRAQLGVAVEHELDCRLVGGVDILRNVRHHQVAGHLEGAGVGMERTAHQLEQRGLAAAVLARNTDLLAAKQAECGAGKQQARPAADRDISEVEHGPSVCHGPGWRFT